MKSVIRDPYQLPVPVTPFAGVWIEIGTPHYYPVRVGVTPFAGVWIEINPLIRTTGTFNRHSLRAVSYTHLQNFQENLRENLGKKTGVTVMGCYMILESILWIS